MEHARYLEQVRRKREIAKAMNVFVPRDMKAYFGEYRAGLAIKVRKYRFICGLNSASDRATQKVIGKDIAKLRPIERNNAIRAKLVDCAREAAFKMMKV